MRRASAAEACATLSTQRATFHWLPLLLQSRACFFFPRCRMVLQHVGRRWSNRDRRSVQTLALSTAPGYLPPFPPPTTALQCSANRFHTSPPEAPSPQKKKERSWSACRAGAGVGGGKGKGEGGGSSGRQGEAWKEVVTQEQAYTIRSRGPEKEGDRERGRESTRATLQSKREGKTQVLGSRNGWGGSKGRTGESGWGGGEAGKESARVHLRKRNFPCQNVAGAKKKKERRGGGRGGHGGGADSLPLLCVRMSP